MFAAAAGIAAAKAPKLGRSCQPLRSAATELRPLFGLFYCEPGNNLWKRKADAAFLKKNITTVKSFFEETLVTIPDAVLDSPVAELPSGRKDLFANVRGLLPPPYETREEEVVLYAAQ